MSVTAIIIIAIILGAAIVHWQYMGRPMSDEEYQEKLEIYYQFQAMWPFVKNYVYAFFAVVVMAIVLTIAAILRQT